MRLTNLRLDLIESSPKQVTSKKDYKRLILSFKERHPNIMNEEIAQRIGRTVVWVRYILNGEW